MNLKMYKLSTATIIDALKENLYVPSKVIVKNFQTGALDDGREWASLVLVDFEEYQTLKSVDLADRAGEIKLSLRNYQGEDLERIVGKTLLTEDFAMDFLYQGQMKNLVGMKFIASMDKIQLV